MNGGRAKMFRSLGKSLAQNSRQDGPTVYATKVVKHKSFHNFSDPSNPYILAMENVRLGECTRYWVQRAKRDMKARG